VVAVPYMQNKGAHMEINCHTDGIILFSWCEFTNKYSCINDAQCDTQ
jgi:hypothetical protein